MTPNRPLAASLSHRAGAFGVAALVAGYPTAEVRELLADLDVGPYPAVRSFADALANLPSTQAAYLARFDTGPARVALYETEYGRMRGLGKGNALADLVGFYEAFGFGLDGGDAGSEMPDHLAVELEFYGLLLVKAHLAQQRGDAEGTEIIDDARRKFLVDHLGAFAAVLPRIDAVAADPVYGPVLAWAAELVAAECAALGVSPAPLDVFAGETGETTCGGCVAIPGADGPWPEPPRA